MQDDRNNVVWLRVVARPRPLPEPANDNDFNVVWTGFSAETINAGDRSYARVYVTDEERDAIDWAELQDFSCPDL